MACCSDYLAALIFPHQLRHNPRHREDADFSIAKKKKARPLLGGLSG